MWDVCVYVCRTWMCVVECVRRTRREALSEAEDGEDEVTTHKDKKEQQQQRQQRQRKRQEEEDSDEVEEEEGEVIQTLCVSFAKLQAWVCWCCCFVLLGEDSDK